MKSFKSKTFAIVLASTLAVAPITSAMAAGDRIANDTKKALTGDLVKPIIDLKENNLDEKSSLEVQAELKANAEVPKSNIIFANDTVKDFLYIRSKADDKSDYVGKLFKKQVAYVVSSKDGYIEVNSGEVHGFIKDENLIKGDEAIKRLEGISADVGKCIIDLNVNKDTKNDKEIVGIASEDQVVDIISYEGKWAKILFTNKEKEKLEGFVNKNFLLISKSFETALSKEAEDKKKAEEKKKVEEKKAKEKKAAEKKAAEARQKRAEAQASKNRAAKAQATKSVAHTSKGGSSAIANAALSQLGRGQDCTMLVTNSLRAVGINYHGWPSGYRSLGSQVPASQAKAGDLIYYNNAGAGVPHIAVYLGNGRAVHGGYKGSTVVASSMNGYSPQFIRVK